MSTAVEQGHVWHMQMSSILAGKMQLVFKEWIFFGQVGSDQPSA